MVKTAPRRSVRFAAVTVPCIASTKPRAIGKAEAGAGAHAVALLTRWNLSKMRSRSPGGMPSPSSRICNWTKFASRQPWRRMVDPSGAYLAALSRMLNSACSNSTASTSSIGRSAATSTSTRWRARIFAGAPQRGADDLAEIARRGVEGERARFEPGHVEQIGDEAVEPLGLVDDGAEQFGLLGVGERLPTRSRKVPPAPRMAASGVLRSWEIEVSSAERRRSVSTVRLTRSMSATR